MKTYNKKDSNIEVESYSFDTSEFKGTFIIHHDDKTSFTVNIIADIRKTFDEDNQGVQFECFDYFKNIQIESIEFEAEGFTKIDFKVINKLIDNLDSLVSNYCDFMDEYYDSVN